MTHAWLIIAHNEFGILQKLVSAIDYPQCDVFIHFDRKVSVLPTILVKKARLFILSERVDVRWGSVSQIQCELTLLKEAHKQRAYDFYHIISGTTLPLKTWEQMNAFFEAHRESSVFTPIHKDLPYQEKLKVRRINLFLKHYSEKGFRGRICQFLWKSGIALQRIFGFEVNKDIDFYKASNWLSLTEEVVSFLLSRESEILKTYRHSFCGDEYFIPTELMASPLQNKICSDEHYLLHNITRSNASVFALEDLPSLRETGYLFARKFTSRS